MARPRCVKSSPVLAITVSAPRGSRRSRPSASLAPPTPPDSSSQVSAGALACALTGSAEQVFGLGPKHVGGRRVGGRRRRRRGSAPPACLRPPRPSRAPPPRRGCPPARSRSPAAARPVRSRVPRRSRNGATPAVPIAMPTVPLRQARPTLSVIITPSRAPLACSSSRRSRAARSRPGSAGNSSTVVVAARDVGAVDAGVGEHDAEPVLGDDEVRTRAHDVAGLLQDQLDDARVLARLARQRRGARRWRRRPTRRRSRPSAFETIFWVTAMTSPSASARPAAPSASSSSRPRSSPGRTSGNPGTRREREGGAVIGGLRRQRRARRGTRQAAGAIDAGQADAGVLGAVVLVHENQHGGQRFHRRRIGERAGVPGAEAGLAGEPGRRARAHRPCRRRPARRTRARRRRRARRRPRSGTPTRRSCPAPTMPWVISAAQPSFGSCTRITFGGTSGTVASTRILPFSAPRISSRIGRWCAKGTASTTRSAAAAASGLPSPLDLGARQAAAMSLRRRRGLRAVARADDDAVAGARPAAGEPAAEGAGAADDRDAADVVVLGRHADIVGGGPDGVSLDPDPLARQPAPLPPGNHRRLHRRRCP